MEIDEIGVETGQEYADDFFKRHPWQPICGKPLSFLVPIGILNLEAKLLCQ